MGGMVRLRRPMSVVIPLLIAIAIGVETHSGNSKTRFGLDWRKVFDSEGYPRDRLPGKVTGGVDAIFIEDRISGGMAMDISALQRAEDPADSLVFNGPVSAPHDLGNAYVIARMDGIDLVLDVRVERLAGEGERESYIELEFNQDLVGVSSGHRFPRFSVDGGILPGYELLWPFRGERNTNDLRVRAHLSGPRVDSVQFERWGEADGVVGYHLLETVENLAEEACFGIPTFYSICGSPLTLSGDGPAYIANGDPERAYAPDSHMDISLNISRLIGLDADFTSILVSSPEDMAFGTFRAFGHFASPPDGGSSPTERSPR